MSSAARPSPGAPTSRWYARLASRRSSLWSRPLVQDLSNLSASSPTAASVSLMLAAFDLLGRCQIPVWSNCKETAAANRDRGCPETLNYELGEDHEVGQLQRPFEGKQ